MAASTDNPVDQALGRFRGAVIACALFSLVVNAALLAVPLYTLQVFDRVLTSRSIDTLVMLSIAAMVVLLLHAALDWSRGKIMARVGAALEEKLSGPVLIQTVAMSARSGQRTAQGLRDLGELRQTLASPMLFSLFDVPWSLLFLVVIFLLHPLLGVLAVVGGLILIGLALLNLVLTARRQEAATGASIASIDHVQTYINNAEAITAMGMMPHIVHRWIGQNREVMGGALQVGDIQSSLSTVSKFVRMALQILVMGIGVALVLAGELTPGGMIAASIILARFLAPLEQAMGAWRGWTAAWGAYKRLKDLLAMYQDNAASVPLPEPEGRVRVDRVSLSLPHVPHPILRGLNFTLEPGEAVGIVGPSGSGKSTLARLLVGVLRPSLGEVTLDGANVAGWGQAELAPHVGYLPQDVQLLNGTVGENIARMREAPAETVLNAAHRAGVHELIAQLPGGYDTVIGTGGIVLSGGQQQRVALARALFGDPRLLVLDEPDSNLDPRGHEALGVALKAARADGRTLILVTHRPAVLAHVDRLIVLRDGAVESDGPRDAVLRALRGEAPADAAPARLTEVTGGAATGREGRVT